MQPKFDRKIHNDVAWETSEKGKKHLQSLFKIHAFSLSYFYIIILFYLIKLMTVKVKFSDKLRVSSGIKTQSTDLLKGRKYASEFQCSFGSLVFLRKAAF